MNNDKQPEQIRQVGLGPIVKWLIGLGMLFAGVMLTFINFPMGAGFVLISLIILPPFSRMLERKFHIRLSPALKLVVCIMILILGMAAGMQGSKPVSDSSVTLATVFDLPALVGKDLAGITSVLGIPDENTVPTKLQIETGIRTWEKTWKKGGYMLMATYDIKTGIIVDLFLGADSDASMVVFQDTKNIIRIGNLSWDSNVYTIEMVKARNGSGYTGAIIRKR